MSEVIWTKEELELFHEALRLIEIHEGNYSLIHVAESVDCLLIEIHSLLKNHTTKENTMYKIKQWIKETIKAYAEEEIPQEAVVIE